MLRKVLVLVVLVSQVWAALVNPNPKLIQDIDVGTRPAFCSILKDEEQSEMNGSPVNDIGFSSFTGNLAKKDTVNGLYGINEFESNSAFPTALLTSELEWPNEVTQVPAGIFDSRVWIVASGFCLPGKNNGSLVLLKISGNSPTEPVIISPHETDQIWFYHRVVWQDMNNDGHLDVVSARAHGGCDKSDASQLVWFENPGVKELTPFWDLHVIHEGTEDIAIRIHDMTLPDGSQTPVIFSAGFWSFELGLTWSETNDWLDSSSIRHMAVDNFGWYFDLEIVDLNKDGRLDVLCTTWSQLGSPGALLAYEMPDDWQNEPWTRHILQDGYKSFTLPGSGSPGSASSFWPLLEMKQSGTKPFLMVSGDDAGNAFVVTAATEDPNDWTYESTTIFEKRGTVGAIAVGDVDDDGVTEVFLPIYESEMIRVMSYVQ